MAIKAVSTRKVSTNTAVAGSYGPMVITSVVITDSNYNSVDDTAVLSTGGYIKILGVGFLPGYSLYLNGVAVATSTYQSANEIRAVTPSIANGTYNLTLFNTNGTGAIYALSFSGFPTWTTGTYTNQSAIVNVQLAVTGDAPLTYYLQGGSTLPSGVTLSSSGLLSGTIPGVTTAQIYTFTVLVDDAQKQTAQQTITLNIQFGDSQWPYTTLLLNGETRVTPFINDASTNSFGLSIAGDTKPTPFNPYMSDGYYSVSFAGGGVTDNLAGPSNSVFAVGTGDITVECWLYQTSISNYPSIFQIGAINQTGSLSIFLDQTASNRITVRCGGSGQDTFFGASATATILFNSWTHLAVVRSGGNWTAYINGVKQTYYNNVSNSITLNTPYIGGGSGTGTWGGNISNLRVSNTALYSATFAPPTSPHTSTSSTLLLACQSKSLTDNSTNNFTLTSTGSPKVSSAFPFTPPTSVSVNTGTSVYFSSTASLTVTGSTGFNINSAGSYTIEAWIYVTGLAGNLRVITSKDWSSGTTYASFGFAIGSDNKLLMSIGSGTSSSTGAQNMPGTATISLNTWYHAAFVANGSTWTIYLNGAVDATGSITGTVGVSSGAVLVAAAANGFQFQGYISNLRIVKSAVYTSTFTPSTVPLTAVASTQLLTCQGSSIVDASTNAFTLTVTGSPKVLNNNYPFTQTISTVSNLNTLGSAYLDGTGDYLTVPSGPSQLGFGTGDFTLELWWYPSVTSTYMTLYDTSLQSDGTATGRLLLDHQVGGYIRLYTDAGATQLLISAAGAVLPNQWNHIAVSRFGTIGRMFINGVVVNTNNSMSTNFLSKANRPIIGANGYDNGTTGFASYIADLRAVKGTALYTSNFLPPQSPLTPVTNTQLLTLQYNGGANNSGIIDNGAFNNVITRLGNATQGSFSPYSPNGWSNYFNGTSDYLQFASNSVFDQNTPFTVEAWVYPVAGSNGYFYAQLNSGYLGLLFNGTKFQVDKSYIGYQITSTSSYTYNSWYHVSMSYDGTNTRLFVNGTSQGSVAGGGATSGAVLTIGYYNSNYFTGYVSNLRVVKGTALYTSAFTPSTVPLTAIANTQLLTCQSNRLIDNGPLNLASTLNGTPTVQAFRPFVGTTTTPTTYSTKFDNTSGAYSTFTGKSSLALGTGDFTIESWVYRTQVVTNGDGWYTGTRSPTASGGLGIKIQNNGTLAWNTSSSYGLGTATIPLYTWAHIAVTRQSGTLKWYVNGVLDYTTTLADNFSNPTAAIGITDDPYYSSLIISNFRLVTGTAVYTSNFTPSTTPLTAITNTALLTCQDAILKDNSATPATVTQFGSAQRQVTFNPFGQTTTTSVSYTPEVNGGSAYFDGTGDYLSAPFNSIYDITETNFTVEAWVYRTVSAEQYIIHQRPSSTSNGWAFEIYSGNVVRFYYTGGSAVIGSATVSLNAWNHVAATRSGTTMKIFVNGVLDISQTIASGTTATGLLYIGTDNTPGSLNMTGYISDLRLIKGTALYTSNFYPTLTPLTNLSTTTSASLLLNFTKGGIVDAHSTNVLETAGTTYLSTAVKKFGNASMYFGTKTDYFSMRSTPALTNLSGDFTIECWVYPTDTSISTTWGIIDARTSGASATAWLVTLGSYSAGWLMTIYNGTSYNGTTRVQANIWTHCAWARVGSTLTFYVNGVAGGTATVSPASTTLTTTTTVYIGSKDNGLAGYGTVGYIDELRITNGFARYTANFTAPTIAFVAQ